eukprot:619855-Alexandrium_andersonii.AAC.1
MRSEAQDVSGYIATNPVPGSRTHNAEVSPWSPRDEEGDAMTWSAVTISPNGMRPRKPASCRARIWTLLALALWQTGHQ